MTSKRLLLKAKRRQNPPEPLYIYNKYDIVERKKPSRRTPHTCLSATQTRKRLYQCGVPASKAKTIFHQLAAGEMMEDGFVMPHTWSRVGLKRVFGNTIAESLMAFVSAPLLLMGYDEFWSVNSSAVVQSYTQRAMLAGRKFNTMVFTQSEPEPKAPMKPPFRLSIRL